jgi:hypothetical protein
MNQRLDECDPAAQRRRQPPGLQVICQQCQQLPGGRVSYPTRAAALT